MRITQTDGSTRVTEGGATDSYFVGLTIAPTAEVRVTIRPTATPTLRIQDSTFTRRNDIQLKVDVAQALVNAGRAVRNADGTVTLIFKPGDWSDLEVSSPRSTTPTSTAATCRRSRTSRERVHTIQGPLFVFGGENPDSSLAIPLPVMLEGELPGKLVVPSEPDAHRLRALPGRHAQRLQQRLGRRRHRRAHVDAPDRPRDGPGPVRLRAPDAGRHHLRRPRGPEHPPRPRPGPLHDRVHALRQHDDHARRRVRRGWPTTTRSTSRRSTATRRSRAATGNDRVLVRNDEGTIDDIAGLLTIDTRRGRRLRQRRRRGRHERQHRRAHRLDADRPGHVRRAAAARRVRPRGRAAPTAWSASTPARSWRCTLGDRRAGRRGAARAVRHAEPERRPRAHRDDASASRSPSRREAAGRLFPDLKLVDTGLGRRAGQTVAINSPVLPRGARPRRRPDAHARRDRRHLPPALRPRRHQLRSPRAIAYNATEADDPGRGLGGPEPEQRQPALPATDNVGVRRFGNTIQLLFRGERAATTIAWVDTVGADRHADARDAPERHQLLRRRDARHRLGSGNDVFNVQGTTATTNLSLGRRRRAHLRELAGASTAWRTARTTCAAPRPDPAAR